MSPDADPERPNWRFCSSETARIHPQDQNVTFATLALHPGTRSQRTEGIHVRAFSTKHEVSFGMSAENQQTLNGTQGPPCLPLPQGPLG